MRKEELKSQIRIGIPNTHKRNIILKMFSINVIESKFIYEEACKSVFNSEIPTEFSQVPTFTHYKSFEEAIPIKFLKNEEITSAKKILWIINQQYKIEFSPLLIITLCLLLLFLSEEEAFSVIRSLIESSLKNNSSHLLRWHFTFKNIEFGRFIEIRLINSYLESYAKLSKKKGRQNIDHFLKIGFNIQELVSEMISSMFLNYVQFHVFIKSN